MAITVRAMNAQGTRVTGKTNGNPMHAARSVANSQVGMVPVRRDVR